MYIIMDQIVNDWITNGLHSPNNGTPIYGYPLECTHLKMHANMDTDCISTTTIGYGTRLYASEYLIEDKEIQDRNVNMILIGFI